MRRVPLPYLAVSFAAALCHAAAGAGAAVVGQDAEGRYQVLLAGAKANAPNADWGQLRLAFAARPGFRVFAQSAAKREMLKDANSGDCADALATAKAVIEEAYVDPDAHMVAAFCEDAAGDGAASKLDRDIGVGLIRSIETGDGLSAATAFTPINVDEEYALMRALGQKVESQDLVRQGGHAYDVLSTQDQKGQRGSYWFAIDRVLAAESAALTPGAISEGGPPSRTP
jgi:hypothetical protein